LRTETTRRALTGALLITIVLLAALWYAQPPRVSQLARSQQRSWILQPPPTPEPLVPTALPAYRPTYAPHASPTSTALPLHRSTLTPTASSAPTAPPIDQPTSIPNISPTPTAHATATAPIAHATALAPTATATVPVQAASFLQKTAGSARDRICVGVPIGQLDDYDWGDGWPGWYLNWRIVPDPSQPHGARFAQMVYTQGDGYSDSLAAIRATAAANAGSLWLIGNEPDVTWQGNSTPEQYASSYGVLYDVIKEADPSAQVAIGGVSQPTPLRLAYLDRVLEAYREQHGEEMPVDVWNVHAFILREERDSWGVGIPPGMAVDRGKLYEISDHADIAIFQQQIADFRLWMAKRGLRNKPLIVSEYGILMPQSYGFPPEAVSQFMVDTFDYFLTAEDAETGYSADKDRLVQAFCWYSAADTRYATSNLFDPQTRAVTPLGEVFRAYIAALR
jgi:hypothetical protein